MNIKKGDTVIYLESRHLDLDVVKPQPVTVAYIGSKILTIKFEGYKRVSRSNSQFEIPEAGSRFAYPSTSDSGNQYLFLGSMKEFYEYKKLQNQLKLARRNFDEIIENCNTIDNVLDILVELHILKHKQLNNHYDSIRS